MRWIVSIILVLTIVLAIAPSVEAAVIYGGKLFHGQNFTTNIGGNFRLYGTDPYTYTDNDTEIKERRYKKIAIISDSDDTVYVFNNTCESTYKYTYCYIESYLDLDNPLTFKDGNIESMISLSVETLPPPTTLIDITKNMSMETYCGQLITTKLSVYNEGTVPTNFSYTETFPDNTFVTNAIGGDVNNNILSYKERIQSNETINYTYTITNFDCQSKNWNAKYSFTTYNETIYRNITNISLTVLNLYNLTDNLSPNKTNGPLNSTWYTINFTNNHPATSVQVSFEIITPGLNAKESSNGISTPDNKIYKYNNFVLPGKTLNLYVEFYGKSYGEFKIKNNATIKITDRVFDYDSEHLLKITPAVVVTYIEINNITNTSLTVDVYIRNDDTKEKYYYLYGLIRGVDETEEPIYYNNIEPLDELKVGSKTYNLTNIKGNINVSFDGVYRDKNSIEYKLSDYRIVKISKGSIVVEEKKEDVIVDIVQVPEEYIEETPSTAKSDDAKTSEAPKKDFITKIIEGFSKFLESIFT